GGYQARGQCGAGAEPSLQVPERNNDHDDDLRQQLHEWRGRRILRDRQRAIAVRADAALFGARLVGDVGIASHRPRAVIGGLAQMTMIQTTLRLLRALGALAGNRSGTAAIELAFTGPALVLFVVGICE